MIEPVESVWTTRGEPRAMQVVSALAQHVDSVDVVDRGSIFVDRAPTNCG